MGGLERIEVTLHLHTWRCQNEEFSDSLKHTKPWQRVKKGKESFTDVILRMTRKKELGTLLDYVRGLKPDEELAKTLEDIVGERKKISLPTPTF